MAEQTSTFGTLESEGQKHTPGPDAPAEEAPAPASILDEIVASLDESQDTTAIWEVESRKGFTLEFDTYMPADDFKRYQASAQTGNRKTRRGRGGAEGIDQFALCMAIVREKNTRIIFNGQDLRETSGALMTLNSPEFLAMIKRTKWGRDVSTTGEAIEEFLTAGFLVQLGDSIITEAGYAGETAPVNR
ncbi:hypothetical protein [Nesterenkonia suensis]